METLERIDGETPIRIADPRDMESNVEVILYDVDGTELSRTLIHNVVTTAGKVALAQFACGLNSQTAWTRQQLGSSAGAPNAADTVLGSPITTATGMTIKTADSISITGTSTLTLDSTWTNASGGSVTVQEAGVWNSNGSGPAYASSVMLAHSLTNTHVVGDGQSLRIIHNVPFA